MLAETFEGKRPNPSNDVVVKSDNSIWFTDPVFGILGNYQGQKTKSELAWAIYRLVPKTQA